MLAAAAWHRPNWYPGAPWRDNRPGGVSHRASGGGSTPTLCRYLGENVNDWLRGRVWSEVRERPRRCLNDLHAMAY